MIRNIKSAHSIGEAATALGLIPSQTSLAQRSYLPSIKPASGSPNTIVRGTIVSEPSCNTQGSCTIQVLITAVLMAAYPGCQFSVGNTITVETKSGLPCVDWSIQQGDEVEVAGIAYSCQSSLDVVNCADGHYIRTGGPPPVCPEGAVNVLEWCPDGQTWSHRQVCRNNAWVDEYQQCPNPPPPPVCSEGAVNILEWCPDGQTWKHRQVCRNNAWVDEYQNCPSCPDGQSWTGSQCACPSGQNWNGQQCIQCSDGQIWTGSQCACPSGQEWNGQQCVTPPPCEVVSNIHVEITRVQFYSKVKGLILNVDASDVCLQGSNLLKATLDVMNTRDAKYTVDVYAGPVYRYTQTVFVDENGKLDFVQELPRFTSGSTTGFYVKLDVNVAATIYLVEYVMDKTLGLSVSDATLWSLTQEVKQEFFPSQPYLMTDPTKFVVAIATYLREHPDEIVRIAAEIGVNYAVDTIIEKASVVLSMASDIVDAVELTIKSLRNPAEESIEVVFSDSALPSTTGSVISIGESGVHKLYLHVYDDQNRHVGIDHQSGSVDLQIPGARYGDSSDGIVIALPADVTSFRAVVDALDAEQMSESYNLTLATVSNGQVSDIRTTPASINKGDSTDYQVLVAPDEGHGFVNPSPLTVIWYTERLGILGVILACLLIVAVLATRKRQRRLSRESRPRVKEIRSTAGKPMVKSIQEDRKKPRVLRVEEE